MHVMPLSRRRLESPGIVTGAYALISFRNPGLPPAAPSVSPLQRIDIVCDDVPFSTPGLTWISHSDVADIAAFVRGATLPIICQCEAGVSRSVACAAAIDRWRGGSAWKDWTSRGTHNRHLYRALCHHFDLDVDGEPFVSLAVRIKYPLDRAQAFLAAMMRQRYDNWQVLFVSDGPWQEAYSELDRHPFVRTVTTDKPLGLWGHPYRQRGINACLELSPAYVGLNNDDNYLTPGYLEQMVGAAQRHEADLVLCQMLHAYSAWGVVDSAPKAGCADVGNWLASAELIRQVPWEGTDFLADGRFVERLAAKAKRVVEVKRPLLVKN